jgi:hypothetical protein
MKKLNNFNKPNKPIYKFNRLLHNLFNLNLKFKINKYNKI